MNRNPSTFESPLDSSSSTTDGPVWPNDQNRRFTLFPLLPLEIRLLVWEHVCFQPRALDIWGSIEGLERWFELIRDVETDQTYGSDPPFFYKTKLSILPGVLHTSQEARKTGLRFYELDFGTEMEVNKLSKSKAELRITTPARIYVNWACDIICPMEFADNEVEIMYDLTCRRISIRRIAMDVLDIPPFTLQSNRNDFEWLYDLLFRRKDLPPKPFDEIILYICLSNDKFRTLQNALFPLEFVNINVDDEEGMVAAGLDALQRRNLCAGRDGVLQVIKVINELKAKESLTFIPPDVSFKILKVGNEDGTRT